MENTKLLAHYKWDNFCFVELSPVMEILIEYFYILAAINVASVAWAKVEQFPMETTCSCWENTFDEPSTEL